MLAITEKSAQQIVGDILNDCIYIIGIRIFRAIIKNSLYLNNCKIYSDGLKVTQSIKQVAFTELRKLNEENLLMHKCAFEI